MAALPLGPSNEQEAILEGLAMAGLVAVLRQLGDLAELAAEVLDGLQDQAMAVSARGRRLAMRAKRLHADLNPSIHSKLNRNRRLDWHPRGLNKESLSQHQHQHGVGEAPPRYIADHIRRCRGPPSLSALDRFDAHGEGACLKRYTDPSFFRTAHSAKLQSTDWQEARPAEFPGGCRSQTEKQSLDFLSMLRQLTHRQISPSLQMHQIRIDPYEPSPEPHMEMDKAKQTHCCSYAGSADYVGNCSDELERTSSFEAWLSPGARFSTHEYEAAEESSQRACSRFVSHAATSNAPLTTDDTVHAKQDSETSCNKGVSRRHRYRGSILEMIASSRVSSCSQDTKVDTPPLVPIPPMQWLSVKVPITYGKSLGKNRAGGKILKTTELSEPALHSYEAWSEPEGTNQQSGADSDKDVQVFNHKGPDISSCRGNTSTVSDSEASKHGDPSRASGVGGEDSHLHHENVLFSAVEQLARMSPPPEVASCGRITLRNGPSPIHRSRSILDQIKEDNKSSSLKPVSGTSSPTNDIHASSGSQQRR